MSESIIDCLHRVLYENAQKIYPDLKVFEIEIARSKDSKFGDYQCNSAMKLSKRYGISPQEWAHKLVPLLEQEGKESSPMFEKIDVKGPGFLNMTLSSPWLLQKLQEIPASLLPRVSTSDRKKIIIDFSSPNIAKEMHVGHLRSTIIGDSLARIFEARGHDVLRLNHVGDWGTAFGMLIEHLKSITHGDMKVIENMSLQDLMKFYKESKVRFDNDPEFKSAAQKAVVKLQSGDPESIAIWKVLCETSRKAFQDIYQLLEIRLQERGESFYNPRLPHIVQSYTEKGLVTESDGAKCIFLEGFLNREGEPLPLMIQKSDGGFNYDTTDLAAIEQRIQEEKADRIIIVTDSGQATHFQMIFAAAEKAGVLDRARTRVDHVPFGLVLGSDGKKFKTRSGETEKLIDLLTNAIDAAKKILDERNPDWAESDRRDVSRILGLGAIKYADLSSHRMSDYLFSYDKMLRFEGNTAAFIMYSYVRTRGIVKKVAKESTRLEETKAAIKDLSHPSEKILVRTLLQFDETVAEVEESLLPNRLTEYLYGLANDFNAFFRDCRVEGDVREQERLQLVSITGAVLKKGLDLLGIHVPEKM